MNRTPQRQPSVPVPPMLTRQKGRRRMRPVQNEKKKADSTKRKLKLKPKASSPKKQTPKQNTGTRKNTKGYNYAEIPLAQLNAFLNGQKSYNAYLKKHAI